MSAMLPGAVIGVIGGGQLGRMLILAGRNLGYRFVVLDPEPNCPAAGVADEHLCAAYTDTEALQRLVEQSDVVTYEFEGLPVESVRWVESRKLVRPSSDVLSICQNRYREKTFLRDHDLPHVPFEVVRSGEALRDALDRLGTPSVLKTAYFGYDGKGQIKIEDAGKDPHHIFSELGVPLAIVEQWVSHRAECSVMVSRTPDGQTSVFPVAENEHRHHILDRTMVPARLPDTVQKRAAELAMRIAQILQLEGTLGVEFFVTDADELIINELAPRPHNSGHFTMDACITSQFEQTVRAVCNLPLGDTTLKHPVVMLNLMGNLWSEDAAPDWQTLLNAFPSVKLHLYGKQHARKGRKMGHLHCSGETLQQAIAQSQEVKALLMKRPAASCSV
ncbi:MAG: 5-(carboxyamino)imidazole ribonucleotide synthase [Puniceicoccaceae bacterium]